MDVQLNKVLIIFALVCYFLSIETVAKKACQPYLAKLRNIQAQQRVGHSNSKGRSLAERERKARNKWWQCQQGKLPKAKKKKTNKKVMSKSSLKKSKPPRYSNNTAYKPFTKNLVIKGKYQGQQQQDWLDYYRKPDKCKKIKSTKIFAYCLADEERQQLLFEQSLSVGLHEVN